MSVLTGFSGRGPGGDVTINTTVQEITASGLSEDAGQVLAEGTDGGALLTGPDIQAALDATLGGADWRAAEAERLLTYDAATRTLGILAGTGVALPLATGSEAGLMSAADKQALAAAAGGAGGVATEPTRDAIASATVEAGVASIRTSGFAAPGDGGGGLYVRTPSEPAHAAKVQSADGAWWALAPEAGRVNVLQFGAPRSTDGSAPLADAHAAFAAALAYAALWTEGTTGAGLVVEVPPGKYLIGQTLEIRANLHLRGQSSTGLVEGWPVELRFPDTAGIVVHDARSDGAGAAFENPDDPATAGASGACLEGMSLRGAYAGQGFDPLKPGIRLRARAVLRDLRIEGFSGHGLHIEADEGEFSNANTWMAYNLTTRQNGGSGLYARGRDANAGHAFGIDASSNGRWGIEDRSFLGNHYFGIHTQSNGRAAAGQDGAFALVSRAGAYYAPAPDATEAALAATEPGTDAAVWRAVFPGRAVDLSLAPDWQAGQPEGTYVQGGPLLFDGATNQSVAAGLYIEPNQPPPVLDRRTTALGGLIGPVAPGGTGQGVSLAGRDLAAGSGLEFDDGAGTEVSLMTAPRTVLRIDTEGTPDGLRLVRNDFLGGGTVSWQVRFDSDACQGFTLDETTAAFGRPEPVGRGHTYFRRGAFLGTESAGRHLGYGADAQGGEDHGPGDLVLSNAPAAGAPIGWLWLTAHDADGAAGEARALWPVPSLDGAVTLPAKTEAETAAEAPGPHAGTLIYRSDKAAAALSDGAAWRDLRALRVVEKSADATLAPEEAHALLRFTGAGAQVLTVPAGAMAPGDQVTVVASGTGAVSLAAGAGVTIDSETTLTLAGRHAAASLICLAVDTYLLVGSLSET